MKKDRRPGPSIILRETGSTNADLEKLLSSDIIGGGDVSRFHGYSELAFVQTAGRGRFDRAWTSSYGGFYQSMIVFMEKIAPLTVSMLIISVSTALFRSVRSFASRRPARIEIKWPNDVAVDGRKVSGILMKSVPRRGATPVIIGTGVNLFNDIDAGSIRTGATLMPGRLAEYCERPLEESDIIAFSELFLDNFRNIIESSIKDGFEAVAAEYSSNLMYLNSEVEVFDAVESGNILVRGIFAGVTGEGFLRVIDAGGSTRVITSGEVRKVI